MISRKSPAEISFDQAAANRTRRELAGQNGTTKWGEKKISPLISEKASLSDVRSGRWGD
jgi:hypothetical protein